MDYKEYNDYELIQYISENNEEANTIMFQKYKPLIQGIAKKTYQYASKYGLEMNDLIQEGMLALNDAIVTFSDQKETSFYTYAKTCIERRMTRSAILSNGLKHRFLNESLSLENTNDEGNNVIFEYLLKDERDNPEKILLKDEDRKEFMDLAEQKLTSFELQVLELKMSGFDYKEIANQLKKEPKSIDNALQRIRNKMRDYNKKEK